LSLYLDVSVLVALFTEDPFASHAHRFLRENASVVTVSDFAAAEFASVIGRHFRKKDITQREARVAFATFDSWAARVAQRVEIAAADVKAAEAFLRRLDLTLRAPDAINIAIAQRIGAAVFTFDDAMIKNARALGTPVAAIR
jgi:predicted nucleic acid-binding protein